MLMEQRRIIFTQRDQILDQPQVSELIRSMVNQAAEGLAEKLCQLRRTQPQRFDAFWQEQAQLWQLQQHQQSVLKDNDPKAMKQVIAGLLQEQIQQKEQADPQSLPLLEKRIVLAVIDRQWNDHVDSMNRLREGIYLRSYAQIKPEDAYREEGYQRFANMMANITDQVVLSLIHLSIQQQEKTEDQP